MLRTRMGGRREGSVRKREGSGMMGRGSGGGEARPAALARAAMRRVDENQPKGGRGEEERRFIRMRKIGTAFPHFAAIPHFVTAPSTP